MSFLPPFGDIYLSICDEKLTGGELLNGGVFKGRHLVADCRNASERISIRTLVDVGQPARGRAFTSASGNTAPPGYAHERANVRQPPPRTNPLRGMVIVY